MPSADNWLIDTTQTGRERSRNIIRRVEVHDRAISVTVVLSGSTSSVSQCASINTSLKVSGQSAMPRECAAMAAWLLPPSRASQQRSSSNVEGRNGYLSLRNHQLRGLDHPRKRTCLTAVHNFFLTRADGTTAAERFFGQKPRSMFAAIFASVEIPPAPLSPPRRAVG